MARPLAAMPLMLAILTTPMAAMINMSRWMPGRKGAPAESVGRGLPPAFSSALADVRRTDGWEPVQDKRGVQVWKRVGKMSDGKTAEPLAIKSSVDASVPANVFTELLLTRDYDGASGSPRRQGPDAALTRPRARSGASIQPDARRRARS